MSLPLATWEQLLLSVPAAAVILDPRGTIVSANARAETLVGYAASELRGMPLRELTPGGTEWDQPWSAEQVESLHGAGCRDILLRQRSGQSFVAELSLAPIDAQQPGTFALAMLRPATGERALGVEALGKSEERLRQAARVSQLGIFDQDHLSEAIYWSPKMRGIFGFGPDHIATLESYMAIVHPEDTARVLAAIKRAHDPLGDGSYDIEHRIIRPDGQVRWILTRSQTFFVGEGTTGLPVRTVGALVDTTERKLAEEARKQSEEALRASEQRLRALIEKNQELIGLIDQHGAIEFASPSVSSVLGYAPDELNGRSPLELSHPDDLPAATAWLQGVMQKSGEAGSATFRVRHRDGSYRHVDAFARNLLEEPALRAVVVNARDVTEKLQMEDRIREVQKLDSIGRLAGGVAHDFNNMLTAILGFADLMEGDMVRGTARLKDLREIVRAAERARDLTRQLLAFARKQVIAPRKVSLNRIVEQSEDFLRRVLGEHIELAVALDCDLFAIQVDPSQIERVILNLAVNARDAMTGGGTLRIETHNVWLDAEQASRHAGMDPGAYALLVMRDDGSGIATDELPHIFEPFFTTKPIGKGTGLGLATVYGIVRQSGGHIWVRSELGVGTTFDVYFPRVDLEPGDAAPIARRGADLTRRTGSERVLVVEDDDFVRALVTRTLQDAGYQVLAAGRPNEALELARKHRGELDLLLTDVVMPGMSGRDLARRMLMHNPGLQVLYVSGYAEDGPGHPDFLERGADFLAKPFTPSVLCDRVRQILDAAHDVQPS